jgi:hypothetical protein
MMLSLWFGVSKRSASAGDGQFDRDWVAAQGSEMFTPRRLGSNL